MFFRSDRTNKAMAAPLLLNTAPAPGLFAGTKVACRSKWCAVEELSSQDQVLTAVDGPTRPISVETGVLSVATSAAMARHWPLLIPKDALGNSKPLRLGPAARIVLEHEAVQILFGEPSVSLKVENLVGYRGIARARDANDLFHVTLRFDRPQTVALEGDVFLDIPGPKGTYRYTPLDDRQSRLLVRTIAQADQKTRQHRASASWI